MATAEEIKEVLTNAQYIALASVKDGAPNIRIVDIAFDADAKKILFVAHKMSPKVAEFEAQSTVAFTTLPPMGPGLTVRCDTAKIAKSDADIEAVKAKIVAKHPQIENMFNAFGDNAQLFEISFNEVRAFGQGKEEVVAL